MRQNLVAVPNSELHDLPPRWDGLAVLWRGWEPGPAPLCTGRRGGLTRDCCESCGSVELPSLNVGTVADDPDMTAEDIERDIASGELALRLRARRARRSTIRLTAFRCTECGADVVLDGETWWTLDASDYGDEGSIDPSGGDR